MADQEALRDLFLVETSTMRPQLRKTRDCAQADHMLQRLKFCRMSAEQEEHEFLQDLPREHLFKSTSTTQAVVSLPSVEAEFYEAVKAAVAGIDAFQLCVRSWSDVPATMSRSESERYR